MTNLQQKGFSLIGLLIGTVTLNGMVAAANVPTYTDYFLMSGKVSEPIALFASLKPKIMNFYSDKGIYPTFQELKDGGIVHGGLYTITSYDDRMAAAGTPQVCFRLKGFYVNKDQIGWKYITDPVNPKQKIWSCKSADSGCTTVEDKYLPKACRTERN